MNLQDRIHSLRKHTKSDKLSMSIGELEAIYARKEINIHPKFQRVLRWDPEQKTRLVESVLLGIPIPAVFVAQSEHGFWDVVDGAQRLGTLFEFLGVLRQDDASADGSTPKPQPLKLQGTRLLPELEGVVFQGDKRSKPLPPALQIDFRRARLDINILLRESDSSAKYELFERLNTGGSIASEQEVRNCVLVWMNEQLFDWMKKNLWEDPNFNKCVELTDRVEDRGFRSELVLRFLTFAEQDERKLSAITDIGEVLNASNRELATNQADAKRAGRLFKRTFGVIEQVGTDAFRKYNVVKKEHRGGFLISAYEAVALGVAAHIDTWESKGNVKTQLHNRIKAMWSDSAFIDNIGIGVPARDRIRHSVPFGRKHFAP